MNKMYQLLNVSNDAQFNTLLESLDLDYEDMISLDNIANSFKSLNEQREDLLELMAETGNYEVFVAHMNKKHSQRKLKENVEQPQEQSMDINDVKCLNDLIMLTYKKCENNQQVAQQLYQMIIKGCDKQSADIFFGWVRNANTTENELKFDDNAYSNGIKVADNIMKIKDNLMTFLNSVKEEKNNEVNESVELKEELMNECITTPQIVQQACEDDVFNGLVQGLQQPTTINITVNKESDEPCVEYASEEDLCNAYELGQKQAENGMDLSNDLTKAAGYMITAMKDNGYGASNAEIEQFCQGYEELDSDECCSVEELERQCEEESGICDEPILAVIKNVCESKKLDETVYDPYNEKYNDIREELNYIKQRYLDGELDVYDATNEVDGLIGDKSNAEAIVDSWDDPSKHGLYGINNEALLNKISNDPNVYIQGRDENDVGQEPDVEKILDSIKYIANTYNKTFSEAKEIYSEISYTDVYSIKELDEDTVYDPSWFQVKGQKYPKQAKKGLKRKSVKESDLEETTTAGNIASVSNPLKLKKRKATISESMFLRLLREGVDCIETINGNIFKLKDGYLYQNGILVKTKKLTEMAEYVKGNIKLELLENVTPQQMDILLEDENDQITYGDMTPEQRQLKQDQEQKLDTMLNTTSDSHVQVEDPDDESGSTMLDNQKLIGVDDSDVENKKYIVQDPMNNKTRIVDSNKIKFDGAQ